MMFLNLLLLSFLSVLFSIIIPGSYIFLVLLGGKRARISNGFVSSLINIISIGLIYNFFQFFIFIIFINSLITINVLYFVFLKYFLDLVFLFLVLKNYKNISKCFIGMFNELLKRKEDLIIIILALLIGVFSTKLAPYVFGNEQLLWTNFVLYFPEKIRDIYFSLFNEGTLGFSALFYFPAYFLKGIIPIAEFAGYFKWFLWFLFALLIIYVCDIQKKTNFSKYIYFLMIFFSVFGLYGMGELGKTSQYAMIFSLFYVFSLFDDNTENSIFYFFTAMTMGIIAVPYLLVFVFLYLFFSADFKRVILALVFAVLPLVLVFFAMFKIYFVLMFFVGWILFWIMSIFSEKIHLKKEYLYLFFLMIFIVLIKNFMPIGQSYFKFLPPGGINTDFYEWLSFSGYNIYVLLLALIGGCVIAFDDNFELRDVVYSFVLTPFLIALFGLVLLKFSFSKDVVESTCYLWNLVKDSSRWLFPLTVPYFIIYLFEKLYGYLKIKDNFAGLYKIVSLIIIMFLIIVPNYKAYVFFINNLSYQKEAHMKLKRNIYDFSHKNRDKVCLLIQENTLFVEKFNELNKWNNNYIKSGDEYFAYMNLANPVRPEIFYSVEDIIIKFVEVHSLVVACDEAMFRKLSFIKNKYKMDIEIMDNVENKKLFILLVRNKND